MDTDWITRDDLKLAFYSMIKLKSPRFWSFKKQSLKKRSDSFCPPPKKNWDKFGLKINRKQEPKIIWKKVTQVSFDYYLKIKKKHSNSSHQDPRDEIKYSSLKKTFSCGSCFIGYVGVVVK